MTTMQALAGLIARYTTGDGIHHTAIPRLSLIRAASPTEPLHTLHQPALCIIAQGMKQVMLGEEIFSYGPSHYLAVSAEVPVSGQVTEASPAEPYLCFRLDLEPALLSALLLEAPLPVGPATNPALMLEPVTPGLLDAAARLVGLLASPGDIAVLAPLIEREILYRLLTGSQAPWARQIAQADSKLHQINRAIGWLKHHYREPFRVETLAKEARMSASALHQHFRAITAMSPLQYQKQLRLQEARRLILGRAMDAASASHEVGYESPSQFSREYRRLFGAPPIKDVARIRAEPGAYVAA